MATVQLTVPKVLCDFLPSPGPVDGCTVVAFVRQTHETFFFCAVSVESVLRQLSCQFLFEFPHREQQEHQTKAMGQLVCYYSNKDGVIDEVEQGPTASEMESISPMTFIDEDAAAAEPESEQREQAVEQEAPAAEHGSAGLQRREPFMPEAELAQAAEFTPDEVSFIPPAEGLAAELEAQAAVQQAAAAAEREAAEAKQLTDNLSNATDQQRYRYEKVTRNGCSTLQEALAEPISPVFGVSLVQAVERSDPAGNPLAHTTDAAGN